MEVRWRCDGGGGVKGICLHDAQFVFLGNCVSWCAASLGVLSQWRALPWGQSTLIRTAS